MTAEHKICPRCGVEKHWDDFHKRYQGAKTASYCKECQNDYNRERYGDPSSDYRKKLLARQGSRAVLFRRQERMYGMPKGGMQALIEEQNNQCAVCKRQLNPACVDHHHDTGVIRGLLCHGCNRGIGLLGDSAEVLQAAAEYIRKHEND